MSLLWVGRGGFATLRNSRTLQPPQLIQILGRGFYDLACHSRPFSNCFRKLILRKYRLKLLISGFLLSKSWKDLALLYVECGKLREKNSFSWNDLKQKTYFTLFQIVLLILALPQNFYSGMFNGRLFHEKNQKPSRNVMMGRNRGKKNWKLWRNVLFWRYYHGETFYFDIITTCLLTDGPQSYSVRVDCDQNAAQNS